MIYKSKQTSNYTVIPNSIFDELKSGLSVGILTYLLSRPKDWITYKKQLYSIFSEGRISIDKAFKELEEKGYIIGVRSIGKDGKFNGYEWIVYDTPVLPDRMLESEHLDDRVLENLLTENQQSEIEQLLSKEELSKEYTKEINKEKHVPKKLTDKEITDKFLYWFNKRYLFHKGKESKYRKLDPTDLNNYKSLMKLYTDPKDWNHAFAMMLENEWVQENGTGTPGHFLVNANFQRYLNKTSVNKKNVYVAQNDLN